jgi:site-specific DNA-methyltransferase (adenine-specific)
MPVRWTVGGRYLDDFRDEMLNDKHIVKLYDFFEPRDIFPNVSIEGGICYFLRAKEEQKCDVFTTWGDGSIHQSKRYLKHVFRNGDEDVAFDVFVRDEKAVSIIEKVLRSDGFDAFSNHVKPRNYYRIDSFPRDASDSLGEYGIWGLDKKKNRVIKYINNYEIPNEDFDLDLLTKWKVFVSKADGAAGQLCSPVPARIIGSTLRGGRNIISTITFLVIGPFETENEAINVQKYMTTKFFRFLLGVRKLKNVYWKNFSFVPYLDFSREWNDSDLYEKFGLLEEEINHIEKMIKKFEE